MRPRSNRLRQCHSGVAALEFAIIAPVLLTICGGLADFGLALRDRMQLSHAVSIGADYAFAAQQSLASLSTVSPTKVQTVASASLTLPSVTVTASSPGPYCVQTNTASTPPASSLTAGSYDTACADGNPAGTYMTITAQYTYKPIMPAYSLLASTALTASVTVRLY